VKERSWRQTAEGDKKEVGEGVKKGRSEEAETG